MARRELQRLGWLSRSSQDSQTNAATARLSRRPKTWTVPSVQAAQTPLLRFLSPSAFKAALRCRKAPSLRRSRFGIFSRPCGFPPRMLLCASPRLPEHFRTGAASAPLHAPSIRSFAAGLLHARRSGPEARIGAALPARSRAGNAHGVHTLRSIAPARRSSQRLPSRTPHMPFPGGPPRYFCSRDRSPNSDAVASGDRSRDIHRGSWVFPAGQSASPIATEAALGFASSRSSDVLGRARHDLDTPPGPPTAGFRFRSHPLLGFSVHYWGCGNFTGQPRSARLSWGRLGQPAPSRSGSTMNARTPDRLPA
jgi:hypothetical protein